MIGTVVVSLSPLSHKGVRYLWGRASVMAEDTLASRNVLNVRDPTLL